MEKYPIYLGGRECGVLSVYREGLLTVFRSEAEAREGIQRLYLFGGGESAYLGTLCPEGAGLGLVKKFSREGLAALPGQLEYAADAEKKAAEPDTLWLEGKNGVLYCKEKKLVAVPIGGVRPPKQCQRRICGRDYIVFKSK